MFTCVLCHFVIELDDVQLNLGEGRVVCEKCYERVTESGKPMPKELRQWLAAAVKE